MEKWENEVYVFAKQGYGKQKDDSGISYFEGHIVQVVSIIKQVTNDKDIIRAAYLHDLIEDTNIDYDYIKQFFGEKVADLVNEVTHEGKEDVGRYFPRLKTEDGIVLKFADRLSNLSRMEPWGKDRKNHYLKKSKFWYSNTEEMPGSDKKTIEVERKEVERLLKAAKEVHNQSMAIRAELKKVFNK